MRHFIVNSDNISVQVYNKDIEIEVDQDIKFVNYESVVPAKLSSKDEFRVGINAKKLSRLCDAIGSDGEIHLVFDKKCFKQTSSCETYNDAIRVEMTGDEDYGIIMPVLLKK